MKIIFLTSTDAYQYQSHLLFLKKTKDNAQIHRNSSILIASVDNQRPINDYLWPSVMTNEQHRLSSMNQKSNFLIQIPTSTSWLLQFSKSWLLWLPHVPSFLELPWSRRPHWTHGLQNTSDGPLDARPAGVGGTSCSGVLGRRCGKMISCVKRGSRGYVSRHTARNEVAWNQRVRAYLFWFTLIKISFSLIFH